MIELPSWAITALEVFYYAVFGPPLALYVAVAVGVVIFVIAHPIWVAIRGHSAGEPLPPITRLMFGFIGFGLLWWMAAPWL